MSDQTIPLSVLCKVYMQLDSSIRKTFHLLMYNVKGNVYWYCIKYVYIYFY
jgi:hypothetical protein